MQACRKGDLAMVKLLLVFGADVLKESTVRATAESVAYEMFLGCCVIINVLGTVFEEVVPY